ncbi:MAG: CbbX protein, partial [Kiloniellaceae bacterium]|nr:CbbX protein [Kiloniellaceae bacterium]
MSTAPVAEQDKLTEEIPAAVDLREEFEASGVKDVLTELDRDMIGL